MIPALHRNTPIHSLKKRRYGCTPPLLDMLSIILPPHSAGMKPLRPTCCTGPTVFIVVADLDLKCRDGKTSRHCPAYTATSWLQVKEPHVFRCKRNISTLNFIKQSVLKGVHGSVHRGVRCSTMETSFSLSTTT